MTSCVSLIRLQDIPEIEPLCHRAFDQMNYTASRGYRYDSQHITDLLTYGVSSHNHILTKCVRDTRILGVMVVGLTDFSFYSVGQRQAFEIVWHGDPLLPPIQQLLVQKALLKDMIARLSVDIFSLTLDEKHLELTKLLDKFGFIGSTRSYVRRSHHG